MDITGGKGSTLVFDTVGGSMFESRFSLLAHKGRLLEIAASRERRVSFDLPDSYHREARLFGFSPYKRDGSACRAILDQLKPGFESQILKPIPLGKRYSLEKAVTAYQAVAHGRIDGKVVFTLR